MLGASSNIVAMEFAFNYSKSIQNKYVAILIWKCFQPQKNITKRMHRRFSKNVRIVYESNFACDEPERENE